MFCKGLHPVCGLPFFSLIVSFANRKFLTLIQTNSSCSSVLLVLQTHLDFLICLSSGGFTLSSFSFRSVVHFEFMFVNMFKFTFSGIMKINGVSFIEKTIPFLLCMELPPLFGQRSAGCTHMGLFLGSPFWSPDVFVSWSLTSAEPSASLRVYRNTSCQVLLVLPL